MQAPKKLLKSDNNLPSSKGYVNDFEFVFESKLAENLINRHALSQPLVILTE